AKGRPGAIGPFTTSSSTWISVPRDAGSASPSASSSTVCSRSGALDTTGTPTTHELSGSKRSRVVVCVPSTNTASRPLVGVRARRTTGWVKRAVNVRRSPAVPALARYGGLEFHDPIAGAAAPPGVTLHSPSTGRWWRTAGGGGTGRPATWKLIRKSD